ncbi:hypothetical protein ACQKDS_11150 [Serratia sp. NPDC078593]|uniref:hypothetical protein n=1 Tax=unclassified Serratia (in: enterobacteria) TaxID=2647522 RepID=UPI0037CCDDE4
MRTTEITPVGVIDKCSIYSLDLPFLQNKDEIINTIKNKTDFGQSCKELPYDIFFSNLGEVGDRLFISGCYITNEGKHTACKNLRNFTK